MRPLVLAVLSAFATCVPSTKTPLAKPTPAPAAAVPIASPIALVHANVWGAAGGSRISDATVIVENGRIVAVGGPGTAVPNGVGIVDVGGKIVTPGIIDVHSHIGVYPSPDIEANADGNEMTDPVTAQVDAQYSIWPSDPNIYRVLQNGGTTTSLILPGSGNLIGGRGVLIHDLPATTVRELKIPGAPPALKMACGENPKRVYGIEKKQFPMTRMGNYAGYRAAFQSATEYKKKWDDWKKKGGTGDSPAKDLKLETLMGVLNGEILVQNHCYRAEEMQEMIELGDEFGFKIRAFHHALEAYKIRDILAKREIAVATWADWWGFKLEAWDGIPQNAALVHEAGARAVIHSDSAMGAQHLNQEAAKALAYGVRAGIPLSEDDALKWITANPAWVVGMEKELGSIEKGKYGDLVVWSADPFSVYARPDQVYVAGERVFDRADPKKQPRSDFELGVTR